jgi:hypothetical protein
MAVKYRFSKDFDFRVNARTDVAYKKGDETVLIPEAHAARADEAGVGQRVSGGDDESRASARSGAAPAGKASSVSNSDAK